MSGQGVVVRGCSDVRRFLTCAALVLLAVPTSPQAQESDPSYAALVNKLGDERIEVRQDAEQVLLRGGYAAYAYLTNLGTGLDSEVASRVGRLRRILRWKRHLTADLLKRIAEVSKTGEAELIAQLDSPDSGPRIGWIDTLAGLAYRDALPILRDLSQDSDVMVASWAALRLAETGDRSGAELATRLLDVSSEEVKQRSLRALLLMNDRRFGAAILRLMKDPSAGVRRAACESSVLCGREADLLLIAALDDPDLGVRDAAVRAVAARHPPGAAQLFLARLRTDTPSLAVALLDGLLAVGTTGIDLVSVRGFLSHDEEMVRLRTFLVLDRGGHSWKPQELAVLLQGVNEEALGPPEVVDRLHHLDAAAGFPTSVALLEDAHVKERVKVLLIRSMGTRDNPASTKVLLRTLRGRVATLQAEALLALANRTAVNLTTDLAVLFNHPDYNVRSVAAQVVARRRLGGEFQKELLGLMGSDNIMLRIDALDALAGVLGEPTVSKLIQEMVLANLEFLGSWPLERLLKLQFRVRREGGIALCNDLLRRRQRLGSVVKALIEERATGLDQVFLTLLGEGHPEAAEYLKSLGDHQSLGDLRKLLNGERKVVLATLPVLGAWGLPESKVDLRRLLEDPDAEVRAATLRAVAETGWTEVVPSVVRLLEDVSVVFSSKMTVQEIAVATLGKLTGRSFSGSWSGDTAMMWKRWWVDQK